MPGSEPTDNGAPNDWRIYQGNSEPHNGFDLLPPPPPWRRFGGTASSEGRRLGELERAMSYRADEQVIDRVNAALHLRRPLLVTGKPGLGKSTLAFNIAYELRLGSVLHWPITSRTTLKSGLYDYDAIGRVHENSLRDSLGSGTPTAATDIGRYIRLGPLGTALLATERPRVLLIDELDKSDIDLPNDLLNVFEEGYFSIPELERLPDDQPTVRVMTADEGRRVPVERGEIRCGAFPIVVITSNGEREFPPAFLRRCIRLMIEPPSATQLADIVEAHLGGDEDIQRVSRALISNFLDRRAGGDLATDQLLNAIYLATSGARPPSAKLQQLIDAVMSPLDLAGPP